MNVAMYLRKSRADENNPLETLERHKEILLSYAKDNNLTVIDIFEDKRRNVIQQNGNAETT
jgi:DNA invertase Pin-like site-specific DNA recombinase